MKSNTLKIYKNFLASATQEQIDFADQVYAICEEHYEDGGDTVVETFEPSEVIKEFKTIKDVQEYCGLRVEAATNCRWGEDNDPEIEALDAFKSSGEW
jgi:hypothetical protein